MNEMKNLWRGREKNEKQTSVTNEIKKGKAKAKISHLCVGETNSHNKICLARERERERVARASEFACLSVRAQEISSSSSSSSSSSK